MKHAVYAGYYSSHIWNFAFTVTRSNCLPKRQKPWIFNECRLHSLTYRSFTTTVSQLKMCDFSGENFKGFEVL